MSSQEPLTIIRPDIAEMWSERNLITPDKVSCGSHDVVWWKGECGHEWQAMVSNVVIGSRCPYCASKKVLAGFNDLATRFPDIAAQWSDKNLPLTPQQVMPFSRKKCWWRCENGHEWRTTVHTRAVGNGCPICSNKVIKPGVNDNTTRFPELAEQWSEKNNIKFNNLQQKQFYRSFWWHCPVCGNDYQKSILLKKGRYPDCPYCTKRKTMPGFNDLATTDPEIAGEWEREKNGVWTPEDVVRNAKKYIWWRCPVGHSWGARIRDRTIDGVTCKTCSAEFRAVFPLWLVIFLAHQEHIRVQIDTAIEGGSYELYIPAWRTAIECGGVSVEKQKMMVEKGTVSSLYQIRYIAIPVTSNLVLQSDVIYRIFEENGIIRDWDTDADLERLRVIFDMLRPELNKNHEVQRKGKATMNEEMKMLLQLILKQEMEGQAGQNVNIPKGKKPTVPQSPGTEPVGNKEITKPTDPMRKARMDDLNKARGDLYAQHENNIANMKEVPIWEKYALSVTEASEYFHIGTKKLRQIIAKDKYAQYLIWNSGRCFIKRKMFEEYLNSEIQV